MKRTKTLVAALMLAAGSYGTASCSVDDLMELADRSGTYIIAAQSDNWEMGGTGVSQQIIRGQLHTTIYALPNEGYRFVSWDHEIYEQNYTFVPTKSQTFTAYFEPYGN